MSDEHVPADPFAQQSVAVKAVRRLFGETTSITAWILALPFWPIRARAFLLTLQGGNVHGSARIFAGTNVVGTKLTVGPATFINAGCHLDATEALTIGADVHLSPRVMVLTVSHAIAGPERRGGGVERAPVTIGDGAWIGAGAIIFPGVHVGRGAVVGAGSIVTRDVDADHLVAGSPAKVVRALPGARDTGDQTRGGS
ncbi:MAG: acyltransferase [Solirubrobacteraceae bacterium]|nr:acyltransferase [Solirubrobacteraceae bacterium]